MTPDAANSTIDNLLQGQSVMLATNHLMSIVVVVFVAAALIIWLAPRPTRAVDMAQAGH
jgi:MFS transporter, DHA2 family, multidrug resistance protein